MVITGPAFAIGLGFTVIVKVFVVPTHPLAVGVTVIVTVIGLAEVSLVTNDEMFPVPLAARPIEGLGFVHA
jgi:hypothetical protein